MLVIVTIEIVLLTLHTMNEKSVNKKRKGTNI
jgi:hypothetical protein